VGWLLLFVTALCVWGQNESGYLTGSIADAAGKPVPGASVSASAVNTGEKRSALTSRSGAYQLVELPPGTWRIIVSAEGFTTALAEVVIHVGSRIRQEFVLRPAGSPEQSQRLATPGIDTETQTQGAFVAQAELSGLPNLTRDPYRLAELAGNVSDAGLGTRGVGLAINGQRESSTSLLFDGADNKDEFTGSVGHPYPLDSTLEFAILTSDFTAQYGRASGGIVNAASKRGNNDLHGTAYEFNRVSALATNSFENNANGIRLPAFTRNQFGAAAGGAIIRNKLFFFVNTEVTLVRSEGLNYAWVASPQLLDRTAPVTQLFFHTLGQLRPGTQTLGTISLGQLTSSSGRSPCIGFICIALPSTLPIFSHVAYLAPGDSGGGVPQNTWNSYNRADYVSSDRTRFYARYGIYSEQDQSGVLSNSPYADYDLSAKEIANAAAISATHQWNPRWTSATSLAFDRLTVDQQGVTSRGVVPTMYANPVAPVTIGSDPIAFPGYNPFSPGGSGAFGGPQNILQINHNTSWSKGKHLFAFGGNYTYIRDNRTDAAYQTANDSLSSDQGLGPTLDGLLAGSFEHIQVAVNPQGNFPCLQTPSCTLNLPATSPGFSRSDRYHDAALYAQDSWRLTRRLTVNLGVRWDYFGVQHDGNPNLDSNWYSPNGGFADNNLISYMAYGGLLSASKSPVGGLYKPDWKDFAPRVGLAWDIFGNGKTSLRGGYGVGYDRNFDNVTFNVIQNLPNYTVLDVPGLITTNNFGPLDASSGSIALPPAGARIIDPYLKTAYARFWNASVQRAINRQMTYSLEFSGSKGINLYSISYPNQQGFGNLYNGDPCTGQGDCKAPPNYAYNEDVGYRGNQGFSSYYGLNNRFTISNLLHSGMSLTAVYTWSHAIDNISSTFFEAGGQGIVNRYGGQNITVNNGLFDLGLLDPYRPNLDRGAAEFDVRHRVVVFGNWTVPTWRRSHLTRVLTTGWTAAPLFLARSGQPFSVFDTTAQTLDLSAPRATFTGTVPTRRNTFIALQTPDTYQLITILPSLIAHELNPLTPGSTWPSNVSARDAFRAPGFWNLDLAVNKETRLTEKLSLQLRAEAFNVFNHANLYVIGATADVGAGNTVQGCFGCTGSAWDRRQLQLAARLSF
jgi:hypothetical protein